jgi:hypothetical protein
MRREISKSINQFVNKLRQLVKRWDNRLILKRLSFSEAYINGRFGAAFVVPSGAGSNSRSFIARQYEHRVSREVVGTIFIVDGQNLGFRHDSNNDQEPVFVGSIEVIHAIKRSPTPFMHS